MVEAGHGHLLPKLEDYDTGEGSEVNDIDTPPMSPIEESDYRRGSKDAARATRTYGRRTP